MRALLRLTGCAVAVLSVAAICPRAAHAAWTQGQFMFDGKPVIEHHCTPDGRGPDPAVIFLHGAGPRGSADATMEDVCEKLAAAGYYAEYIEYYSQTEDVTPGEPGKIRQYFPVWMDEIGAGLDAMEQNPRIDPKRIGMMGYSLGAFLSLAIGTTEPGKVSAIVEYYGALPTAMQPMAANLPPTLILHGDADQIVPVARAHELDSLMTEAKRPHEMRIYPGANHAFNFPIPLWYNAADTRDAWDRALAFFAQYLAGKPGVNTQASAR